MQNASLKALWETTFSDLMDPSEVLGQDLVDIITEKHKQPPDVSYKCILLLHV